MTKNTKPEVSIIVRTKNEEKWIGDCLNAINNQTYKNYELIFVYDDTDKTLEDYTSMDFSDYAETSVKVIVKNKNNPYWFDIMMDKLYNSNPINVSIVEDNKHMDLISEEEIISEAEDTLTTLNNYVNNMETKVDKRKLQTLFAELYTEAQNMEL